MTEAVTNQVVEFLKQVTTAMGIAVELQVETTPDGPRINLHGEGAELLVRRRGEPLKALQHIVDAAFGREIGAPQRIFIDSLDYRRGKDRELKQMAVHLANKAKDTGVDQQLGPLNPYERRLVHIAVAEVPGVTTESVGDALQKTVLISRRSS